MRQRDIDENAVLGLSAGVLATLSPAELPLLDAMGHDLVGQQPRRSDGAIGFGDTEISWIMAAVPVATVVCDLLLDVVKGATTDVLKEWATSALDRFRRRSPQPRASVHTPPEVQALVERIGRSALDHGTALGLDPARAQLLADAMRGAVVAQSTVET